MQPINRRGMLATAGGALMALSATGAIAARRRPFFQRIGKPIGLQIYTLGNEAARDIDATFSQVAAIGYRTIELPGLLGKQPAELAIAAARAGLKIVSLHLPLLAMGGPAGLSLASEASRISDAMGALGAHWAVAPIALIPGGFRPRAGETMEVAISRAIAEGGVDIWKQTADRLNRKAAELKPLGIRVGYHNHNLEFAPIGETNGWNILWQETDPGLVSFEVDLGWVAAAGLDPVRFLETTRGRVRLLHVKDVAAGNVSDFRIGMKPAEVGSGTLDWARILPAAHRAGVEHYLVEQEPPFTIPRIEAATRSFRYLEALQA